ncbi:MAG: NUDIX domain-containing protein [Clostridia bacterium]|nr:NUDIX domain-containing protein [Clostridia bacterium]
MEKRDLYDENKKVTGKTYVKGEQIPKGSYGIVVVIFIQNSEGKFLIQKRSERKNGLYASTGGHPKMGESSLDGILTEVKEEIGLSLNLEDIKLFFSGKSEEERMFWDDYYIKMDIDDISKLELQEEEVSEVSWKTEEEIRKLMEQGKFFRNDFEEFEVLIDWLKNK